MKKILFISLLAFLFIQGVSAQWSVGARFGGASGVSLKSYSRTGTTHFEFISAFNFDENVDGFSVTILGEKFGALSESGKLGAILGVGETMIFGDEFLLGVSGIIGFDWRIGRVGLQLDWLPTWIFVNDSYFSPINAAVTARWMFGGRINAAK
ncbi:MAG: hypothetical protein KBA14_00780 [Saprospiraceae bacterium]|nr:hypothetical protein [Saprospiraceae bacterium]